jgi:cysteine desulfurase/selenocysteine lyase
MMVDVIALRAATPGCNHVAHFNHSGASLPSTATLAAVREHLEAEAIRGPIESGIAAAAQLESLRSAAARLLNAQSSEIAFTSSAAASWGVAFAALPPLQPGDRILVGRHEWGGNLATMRAAARRAGVQVDVIACDEAGAVSAEALAAALDSSVKLVALTWCPANGGLINPAARIGEVCRAARVPYFVDAGQALGQLPVDVQEVSCDVLTGAGRKYLRGPRGTGILYVRQGFLSAMTPAYLDVLSAPWQDGEFRLRDDARRLETSELPLGLLFGLKSALDSALTLGMHAIRNRVSELAGELRARLGATRHVRLLDLGREHSGLVSFNVGSLSADEMRRRLALAGFNVAANTRAYTPLDMTARELPSLVRASVHCFNTEDEIERLARAVAETAATL